MSTPAGPQGEIQLNSPSRQASATGGSLGPSTGPLTQPDNQLPPSKEGIPGLPTLVDIPTVSRSFGISTRQVRRFVADGQIPFVRVGHLIRFDLDALKQWIDQRRAGSVKHG